MRPDIARSSIDHHAAAISEQEIYRQATYPLYLTHALRASGLAGSKQKLVSLQYSLRDGLLQASERSRLLLDRRRRALARALIRTASIYRTLSL
jgi:hypothetical protein